MPNYLTNRPVSIQLSLLLLLFAAGPVVAQSVGEEALSGHVSIEVVLGHGIAVAVDRTDRGSEGEADGVVDELFLLQAAIPIPAELPLYFERAHVELFDGGLTVAPANSTEASVVLLVDKPAALAEGNRRSKRLGSRDDQAPSLVWLGYGLSHVSGEWLPPVDPAWFGEPIDPFSEATCIGGGPGSTACSVGCGSASCSVTCGEDSYACCSCGVLSGPRCRCIPDLQTTGGSSGCVNTGDGCPAHCVSCNVALF